MGTMGKRRPMAIEQSFFNEPALVNPSKVKIRCRVQHIRYHNDENGYSILIVRKDNSTKDFALICNVAEPYEGTVFDATGEWIDDQKWGRQFKADTVKLTIPSSIDGIRKFLGSGMIDGIGETYANRIVDKFGASTLDVLNKNIEWLKNVNGIGEVRFERIKKSWAKNSKMQDVMVFLQSIGVSSSYCSRIYKKYGKQTIDKVKENPYILIDDIDGIGFVKADSVALNMGYDVRGEYRIKAGLTFTLKEAMNDGHCYMKWNKLMEETATLLKVEKELVTPQLSDMVEKEELKNDEGAVYLPSLFFAETVTAKKLVWLLNSTAKEIKVSKDLGKNEGITYDDVQMDAIRMAMKSKVMVMTGGPGTGKTTTTKGIISAWQANGLDILLAAPTGRAAKRMTEATGMGAKTIHRLLEFNPENGGFARCEVNPLDGDALIIDEASMVDIELMKSLVAAIPQKMRVVFVGDIDQLPSVGPGNVLRDMINSGVIPVVRLTRIFRQAQTSRIITNAHLINEGKMPVNDNTEKSDFFFIQEEDNLVITEKIIDLVTRRLPKYYGVEPGEIQVLSPMKRSNNGVQNLNIRLQQVLNPYGNEYKYGFTIFRVGDKVMQTMNDYDLGVFNGDMGTIIDIIPDEGTLYVDFGDGSVEYKKTKLKNLVLSYATTIHKSQGSEYKVVVMPITSQFYMMLQRNLIYTGVTRAKKACVIIGQKKALAMAVRNKSIQKRNTLLKERLISESRK